MAREIDFTVGWDAKQHLQLYSPTWRLIVDSDGSGCRQKHWKPSPSQALEMTTGMNRGLDSPEPEQHRRLKIRKRRLRSFLVSR